MGLVRYPTTLAPASGTQSVTTQCADNAHRTSSSLSVTCSSSGIWGGQTPQCQCDSGYQTATVNERQICSIPPHLLGIYNECLTEWLKSMLSKITYLHFAYIYLY